LSRNISVIFPGQNHADAGQWYIWQTALRLVQGYGRSIRSKDDWAKTYVLDSAFGLFVRKNKNILPSWFIQAIQRDLLGLASDSDSSKVFTPFKENHNPVTNNHYASCRTEQTQNVNNTTAEKNEVVSTTSIKTPSGPSETLTSLDKYIEDESNRQEWLLICPYCPKFTTALEIEYQRHIVSKHPGKPGYPIMAVAG
jgi:hypothetical protein